MTTFTPTIEAGDYAILSAVWLDEWSVWLLAREETMSGINAHFHGLGERELQEHFFRLWDRGLIECSQDDFESVMNPDSELACQHLRDRLDRPLVYRMTKTGGKVWEYFASADWSRFVISSIGAGPREWTLGATSRVPIELANKCFTIRPTPIPGTERWEVLQPWQALYWKELALGHRLTFQYECWDRPEAWSEQDVKALEELSPYWGTWHRAFEDVCREHFGKS